MYHDKNGPNVNMSPFYIPEIITLDILLDAKQKMSLFVIW